MGGRAMFVERVFVAPGRRQRCLFRRLLPAWALALAVGSHLCPAGRGALPAARTDSSRAPRLYLLGHLSRSHVLPGALGLIQLVRACLFLRQPGARRVRVLRRGREHQPLRPAAAGGGRRWRAQWRARPLLGDGETHPPTRPLLSPAEVEPPEEALKNGPE